MTHDFGGRPSGRRSVIGPTLIGGGVAAALVFAVLAYGAVQAQVAKNVAKYQAWVTDGPACPLLTRATLAAQRAQPKDSFTFNGDSFAHASGAASCDQVKNHGGRGMGWVSACKFPSPEVLEVKTASADVLYGPGIYQPAIITVENEQPHCVLVPRDRAVAMMAQF